MNNICTITNDKNKFLKTKIKKNKLKLGLKKNFYLSTNSFSSTNIKNRNKKTISLFIDKNPFHYKTPLENISNYYTTFSERKNERKKLMDSISEYSKNTHLKSKEYKNCISELMSKYSYSNPDADTTNITNYEMTKSKINFYKKNKEYIENYLKKSNSNNKYHLHNLKIHSKEKENIFNTKIKFKNNKYQGPVDSFGLLLRNKIVHDKILLNYQDREVHKFGKTINKINSLNKFEKYYKNIKITSIIPTILDNDLFNYNYLGFNAKYSNQFNETDNQKNNQKKGNSTDKMIYLEINDFIKGSIYLLCDFFRPKKIFPETRENFCMNYDLSSNNILLFSGNTCNIYSNQLWKFNCNNYEWSPLNSNNYIPDARCGHTGIIYKNKYYIFGGQYLHSGFFAKLDIYNLDTNTWTNCNHNSNFLLFFKLRKNHISCKIGPQIFIHGGIGEDGEILDDSYLLNLNSDLDLLKANIFPISIPPKLAYHSCCLVMNSEVLKSNKFTIYKFPTSKQINNRIKERGLYIFGGKNKKICNDMWLLRIGQKPLEWIKVNTFGKPPCPRYLCSMNFFEKGNFIIIHGGKTKINDKKFALKDTYLFELYRYQWIKVDYGEKAKIVKPRCSHCSVICKNKLFILGGINEKSFNGGNFFIINLDINKARQNLSNKNQNKNNFLKSNNINNINQVKKDNNIERSNLNKSNE